MNKYNPELAREVYVAIKKSPDGDFPITALLVDGVLHNFVYGYHICYFDRSGETRHLSVSGDILSLGDWSEVQKSVQGILDSKKEIAA